MNVTDRSAGGDFVAFVGADDYSIAKATGEVLLKAIGGKGDVIIIEGVRGAATAQDRLRGFKDAIAEFPDVKLVDSQPGNYQRLQAMQVMENLLQSNPNVAGVMAANDAMAIGAMDALADANSKAQIVGINGTKEAVDAIKAGKMLATGDYNGFVQGCIGTEIAIRYLRHEPVPKKVTQPSVVVTDVQPRPLRRSRRPAQVPGLGSNPAELRFADALRHSRQGQDRARLPTRLANYDAHKAFLSDTSPHGVRIVMSGPLVADDGTTMIGSLFLVEAADRATVEAFNQRRSVLCGGESGRMSQSPASSAGRANRPRHCERSEAIQWRRRCKRRNGLLRRYAPRNDDLSPALVS